MAGNQSCLRVTFDSDPAQESHDNDVKDGERHTAGHVNFPAQFLEAKFVKPKHRARDEECEKNEGQTREVYLVGHCKVGVFRHI